MPSSPRPGTVERRANPRYLVMLPVHCTSGEYGGRALIIDVSASGARIERLTLEQVPVGGVVSLELRCFSFGEPIVVESAIVRHAPDGFAVRFLEEDVFMRAFLKLAMLSMRAQEDPDAATRRGDLLRALMSE